MRRAGASALAAVAYLVAGCGGGTVTPTTAAPATRAAIPARPKPPPRPPIVRRPEPPPRPPIVRRPKPPPWPPIIQRPIPYGPKRRAEMRAYALRHYGLRTWRLRRPRVIVEHYTASSTFASAFATFAADVPDVELHELPGVCSHFVIDRRGTIYQLVSTRIMCRHTVGLNDVAIAIEHVGLSDAQVLGDRAQLRASLRLTRWLRCRYGIAVRDVIGHAESLRSRYHHERIARLRTQTHGDMARPAMEVYRGTLRRLRCGR